MLARIRREQQKREIIASADKEVQDRFRNIPLTLTAGPHRIGVAFIARWTGLNINDSADLDPLIKMALIHHQFESIHPFYDGNGRTGRTVNVLYLVNWVDSLLKSVQAS